MKIFLALTILLAQASYSFSPNENITYQNQIILSTLTIQSGIEGRVIELCDIKDQKYINCSPIGSKSFYTLEELHQFETILLDKATKLPSSHTIIGAGIGLVVGGAIIIATGGTFMPVVLGAGATTYGGLMGRWVGSDTSRTLNQQVKGLMTDSNIKHYRKTHGSFKTFLKIIKESLNQVQ